MFYAILPTVPPVFAVQPNEPHLNADQRIELLGKLGRHFMHGVSLVTWDESGRFINYGAACNESQASDENLMWREFELPPEPELPF